MAVANKIHATSIEELAKLFSWLDQREVQQTTAIVELYKIYGNINEGIDTLLERDLQLMDNETQVGNHLYFDQLVKI